MSIIVPDVGEKIMLNRIVGNSVGSLTLKLYKNSIELSKKTVTIDFIECNTTGYSSKILNVKNWVIANETSEASYPAIDFSFTTATKLEGYYITNQNGEVVWCEKFYDGPYILPAEGGTVSINVKIQLT